MYPILFEFGIVTVFSLWLLIAIGFVVSGSVFIHLAKRYRVKLTVLSEHSFSLFFWSLIASRLFFILFHPILYFSNFHLKNLLKLFAIWDKGLSFWGALFGWSIGIWYFSKKHSQSVFKLLDLMLPSILLGMFFGNLGAFFDGINYGTPTTLPWGFTFRSANVKFISPIHPTQFYSALYTLGIGVGLLILLKKIRTRLITNNITGLITELSLLLFSCFKFLEEFVRGDETLKLFSLRLPQVLAAIGMLIGGYLLYQRYAKHLRESSAK